MPIPEDTVVLAMRLASVTSPATARVSTVVVNARESIHTIVDLELNDVTMVHVYLTDRNTTKLTHLGTKNLPEGL